MLKTTNHARRLLSRRYVLAGGLAAATLTSFQRALAQSTEVATPVATPVGTPPGGSTTPVGTQFAWVLEVLNSGGGLTEEAVNERFSGDSFSDVPASDIVALFEQLGAAGPFVTDSYTESADGLQAEAGVAAANGDRLAVVLAVEADAPHLITGLRFQRAGVATPAALASWDELDQAWSALASSVNFLAAEVVDQSCVPVHALHADKRLAIGSTFKLYILGELADQVRDGEAGWDDPLAIRDDWKASFSAPMNALDAGEERTLREFAAEMISISDNTATDHLLFHLGRENVEAIQAEMGHGEPEINQPMFSAQELFQLKFAAPAELVDAYRAATVEGRRELLETQIGDLEVSPLALNWWTKPVMIDEFEWFASAEDLCHAMATLRAWSLEPGLEPITEILSINPGLPFDESDWDYVGYKGGSELGVLNLTWLLQRADGRTFVMTGSLNDTESAIDETAVFGLLQAAAQLLAETA